LYHLFTGLLPLFRFLPYPAKDDHAHPLFMWELPPSVNWAVIVLLRKNYHDREDFERQNNGSAGWLKNHSAFWLRRMPR
jgi:hypothetical protein